MKKLTLYALVISMIISLIYSFKIYWLIDNDLEFYRASVTTLVSEIGLWCAYYYARDYEGIKAHEAHHARLRAMFENPNGKQQ